MPAKIYHVHIHKTGGTSLNEWLDDCVSYDRALSADWAAALIEWYRSKGLSLARCCASVAYACWDFFDVLHGHENILPQRPANAIVLTVLRDPVARAISLFHDLASLTESDFAHKRPAAIALHRDCLAMPFAALRQKWGKSRVFREIFNDSVCRLFLVHYVPYRDFLRMAPEERFRRALANIERQVDAFGVAEQMDKTVRHFSQVLGLYPKASLPKVNVGRPPKTEVSSEDRRYLESITVGDHMLFNHLLEKFDNIQVDYSVEAFEKDKLQDAMQRVEIKQVKERIIYGMSAALIGDGFWGRDSRGEPDCCRWSGPGDDSVLYVPSFHTPLVKIAIDVRGWQSPLVRSCFRVKVWGEPVEHTFTAGQDLADVVRLRGSPRDGVLKLEFHAPGTIDEECGRPFADGRRKGFSINRIVIEPG
jgi:hypothetical protein